ncbi:hypothetical protein LEMLEM_LOCUS7866 [Lemmus lemmus]
MRGWTRKGRGDAPGVSLLISWRLEFLAPGNLSWCGWAGQRSPGYGGQGQESACFSGQALKKVTSCLGKERAGSYHTAPPLC